MSYQPPYNGGGGGGYPPFQPGQPQYNNQQSGYPPGNTYPSGMTGMPQPFQYNQSQVGFAPPQPGYPPSNNNYPAPYPQPSSGPGYPPAPQYDRSSTSNQYPPSSSNAPPYASCPPASYQAFNNASGGLQQQQQHPYYGGPSHGGSNNVPGYPPNPQNQPQQQHYNQPSAPSHAANHSQQQNQGPPGTIYPNLSASQSSRVPGGGLQNFEPTVRATPGFNAQIDAEVLYKAMKGFGTDEKALIRVLCRRTSDERGLIVKAFKQMYGKDFIHNLKSEVSGNFETLMVSLCHAPDVYDAMNIRKAVEGLGTDENSLVEILCSRNNREIQAMQVAYRQMYNRNMEHDIKGDTSGYFARLLISLLTASRDESTNVDVNRARQTAEELYKRGEKRWGTDEAYFNSVIAAQSYGQLRAVFDEYQRVTNHSMEQAINAEMSGDVKSGMLAIIKCVRNPPAFFAEQLYRSMKGAGTADHVLIRVLITRCEKDLGNVKREFQQMYGKSLEQFIKGDTTGDYERGLLALCGVVP